MAVRPPGRDDGGGSRPEPGLFRSWPDLAITLAVWAVVLLALAAVFGALSHVAYNLFMYGWDLIG